MAKTFVMIEFGYKSNHFFYPKRIFWGYFAESLAEMVWGAECYSGRMEKPGLSESEAGVVGRKPERQQQGGNAPRYAAITLPPHPFKTL